MCRNLAFAATALAAGLAGVLSLGAPVQAAVQAMTPVATPAPTPPQPPTPAPRKKASAQERLDAERLPPLSRATFWAREVDIDPTDAVANVRLASALRGLGQ